MGSRLPASHGVWKPEAWGPSRWWSRVLSARKASGNYSCPIGLGRGGRAVRCRSHPSHSAGHTWVPGYPQ
eukprot:2950845-Rhodomonas_salina.1